MLRTSPSLRLHINQGSRNKETFILFIPNFHSLIPHQVDSSRTVNCQINLSQCPSIISHNQPFPTLRTEGREGTYILHLIETSSPHSWCLTDSRVAKTPALLGGTGPREVRIDTCTAATRTQRKRIYTSEELEGPILSRSCMGTSAHDSRWDGDGDVEYMDENIWMADR